MKIIISVLLLLSFHALACTSDLIGEGMLSSINEPAFSSDTSSHYKEVEVRALLHLSSSGNVSEVIKLEVNPDNLPKEPILASLKNAKFLPRTNHSRAIEAKDFDFVWIFELNKKPELELGFEF